VFKDIFMAKNRLNELKNTQWTGSAELWLDPQSNKADLCTCSLLINEDRLDYQWSYRGKDIKGSFIMDESGAIWLDSWHQPTSTKCIDIPAAWGIFTLEHCYKVPLSACWKWRSKLCRRPNGQLVLQMTNITPWGEEGRAVRMVFSPL